MGKLRNITLGIPILERPIIVTPPSPVEDNRIRGCTPELESSTAFTLTRVFLFIILIFFL